MPKARREADDSSGSRLYSRPPRTEQRRIPRNTADDDHRKLREWEEATCPICMEHPHSAVLLRCLSPGCRPYVCNTGVRHSNCLEELYKTSTQVRPVHGIGEKSGPTIACPLCRGLVHGWDVIDSAARKCMNSKPRSCLSSECDFSGTYAELRKHVRSEHPYVRPREVDPSRQNAWETMEQERVIGDLHAVLLEEDQGIQDLQGVLLNIPTELNPLMTTFLRQFDAISSSLPSGLVRLRLIRTIRRDYSMQGSHNEEGQ